VNTVCSRNGRDIRPIIHHKGDTLRNQQRRKPLRGFEQFPRGRPLVPVLEQPDAGGGKSLGTLYFGNGKQCCV